MIKMRKLKILKMTLKLVKNKKKKLKKKPIKLKMHQFVLPVPPKNHTKDSVNKDLVNSQVLITNVLETHFVMSVVDNSFLKDKTLLSIWKLVNKNVPLLKSKKKLNYGNNVLIKKLKLIFMDSVIINQKLQLKVVKLICVKCAVPVPLPCLTWILIKNQLMNVLINVLEYLTLIMLRLNLNLKEKKKI